MNDFARRLVMDRASNNSGRGRARRGYDRAGRSGQGRQGYRGDGREYTVSYDGRQGVRGTGRYGIGGSMYRGDRESGDYARGGRGRGRDRDYDYNDYNYEDDYEYEDDYGYDGHEKAMLSKKDMQEWKHKLQNADGSFGEHFDMQKIIMAAEKMGIKFDEYSEKELVMTANMLYSDYCEALKMVVPKEKEDVIYTKMAKAFLEDDDFDGEGSEKLALYYYAIVCGDEE